ncbi:hypothetical protein GBQ70_11210 [Halomicrobium sp. ZPS1]|uniref:Uncharacterized protein n=3 Tax=Haloarculaceae TaxID=1963268 RepID=C7P3Q9_HALMD|nr:hypothetical protein Hmuk_1617 [Halomicrobium mukohataei DSM 12286]QCD66184.1 hypothetical protein E5139_11215 [Halomicrobium mukohataei]QFR20989.1 hypothetical protein GBQ70_11210 [Halomicrobium sp. ZPS1]
MGMDDGAALVSDLESIVGDALRVVAWYDEDRYELLYVREDLTEHTQAVSDAVYENLVLEGIAKEYLEDLFESGELYCTIHEFEELRAHHFVTGQFEGFFVGVDSGGKVESRAVKEAVHDHVEG